LPNCIKQHIIARRPVTLGDEAIFSSYGHFLLREETAPPPLVKPGGWLAVTLILDLPQNLF
jgi:hypothetical protein